MSVFRGEKYIAATSLLDHACLSLVLAPGWLGRAFMDDELPVATNDAT